MQQADLRDMFKYASKSVCISTIAVTPNPFLPNPSTSSAMKTSETQKRTLMTLNQQMKKIFKSSEWWCSSNIRAVMKNYLYELRSV